MCKEKYTWINFIFAYSLKLQKIYISEDIQESLNIKLLSQKILEKAYLNIYISLSDEPVGFTTRSLSNTGTLSPIHMK